MDPIHYEPAARLGVFFSVIFAYGFALIGPGVAAALAFGHAFRMARRARRAEADFAKNPTLAPGHATLSGVVDGPEGEPAVELVITQSPVAFQNKGGRGVRWVEVGRDVRARRFDLVLDSGERIHVAADARLGLTDDLGPREKTAADAVHWARSAAVESGDRVFVVGVLSRTREEGAGAGGGYRGGGRGWAIRGTSRERLLVSTKPFAALFQAKARFSAWTAALVTVALVAFHAIAFRDFHRLNVAGEVVAVGDLQASTFDKPGKRGPIRHYVVEGTAPIDGGIQVKDETSMHVHDRVEFAGVRTVPFVVIGGEHPVAQIGTAPGISELSVALLLVVLLAGSITYFFVRKARMPWWEKKRVIDVVSSS